MQRVFALLSSTLCVDDVHFLGSGSRLKICLFPYKWWQYNALREWGVLHSKPLGISFAKTPPDYLAALLPVSQTVERTPYVEAV
jgi:hypothetical protein